MTAKWSLGLAVMWVGSLVGAAQQHQAPPPPPGSLNTTPDLNRVPDGVDPAAYRAQAYQQRLRAEERRKRLLADSAQLLALATELKAEIEKTGGSGVSAEVARKAADAEKVARELGKLNKDQAY